MSLTPDRKKCARCQRVLPAGEYHRSSATKSGLHSWCRSCVAADKRRYSYGLTDDAYRDMLRSQGGVCAICCRAETVPGADGGAKALSVDHDHNTGEVRGLLCTACNVGLGKFGDDPTIIERALAYVLAPPEIPKRECTACHETLPLGRFNTYGKTRPGRRTICRACASRRGSARNAALANAMND